MSKRSDIQQAREKEALERTKEEQQAYRKSLIEGRDGEKRLNTAKAEDEANKDTRLDERTGRPIGLKEELKRELNELARDKANAPNDFGGSVTAMISAVNKLFDLLYHNNSMFVRAIMDAGTSHPLIKGFLEKGLEYLEKGRNMIGGEPKLDPDDLSWLYQNLEYDENQGLIIQPVILSNGRALSDYGDANNLLNEKIEESLENWLDDQGYTKRSNTNIYVDGAGTPLTTSEFNKLCVDEKSSLDKYMSGELSATYRHTLG